MVEVHRCEIISWKPILFYKEQQTLLRPEWLRPFSAFSQAHWKAPQELRPAFSLHINRHIWVCFFEKLSKINYFNNKILRGIKKKLKIDSSEGMSKVMVVSEPLTFQINTAQHKN